MLLGLGPGALALNAPEHRFLSIRMSTAMRNIAVVRMRHLALVPILFGCTGTPMEMANPDMGSPSDLARPELGEPLTAPPNSWTWIDFPDSTCNEGTPTGLGVNLNGSKNLLVFLMGGGACWDYSTCFVLNTATHGPFGEKEFKYWQKSIGILNRGAIGNPFSDWNMVFVPYCTGDVHSGSNVATYASGDKTKTYRHMGRANMVAYLKRLAATIPSVDRFVVSGSSAGGYGASFDYDLFRSYFPTGKGYMIDDSGPPLEGDEIPPSFRNAWYKSWGFGNALDPICPACRDDLSQAVGLLAKLYPGDRFALLSSLQDSVIRGYLLKSAGQFQDDLLDMVHHQIEPTNNFRYFLVPGQTHTMLGAPALFSSEGVDLVDWLTQEITDDSQWKSIAPPTD